MRTGRSFGTLKKKIFIVLIIVFAILSGLWYAFFYKGDSEEKAYTSAAPETCVPSPLPTVTPKLYIMVHVCGSVVSPGVFRIEKGSRLIAAVEAAGGFDIDADRDFLNLAKVVNDGEKIYVPSYEETESYGLSERTEGKWPVENGEKGTRIININTATAEELTALPGIGESRAKDIVAYRARVGPFEKKEDIKNISGIGDSLYLRIADQICTE